MDKSQENSKNRSQQSVFEQYPWAANHNDAISWLTHYMDEKPETVIKQFDDRILYKVAKDHLILTDSFAFS